MVIFRIMIPKVVKKVRIPSMVRHYRNQENIILRDYLALERTRLANERTLFAYIRTSLYIILAGTAIIHLDRFQALDWLGYILVVIGCVIIPIGLIRYIALRRKLVQYYPDSNERDSERVDEGNQ